MPSLHEHETCCERKYERAHLLSLYGTPLRSCHTHAQARQNLTKQVTQPPPPPFLVTNGKHHRHTAKKSKNTDRSKLTDMGVGNYRTRCGGHEQHLAQWSGILAVHQKQHNTTCKNNIHAIPTNSIEHRGGGVSTKCEVMGFCLKLATSKKGGDYPFCEQLKFSKTRCGGLPWMCTSVYLSIVGACRRKFGGVLLQK